MNREKTKNNYFIYTDRFSKNKGYFNIYQAINGGIHLVMGNCHTELSSQQILDLNIDILALEDYNHELFQRYYGLLSKEID